MAKRKIGPNPYVYPIPIVLIGAMVDGRANYATVGECGLLGIRPPLVIASVATEHFTTPGIEAAGAFSINVPTTEMLALVDHFGSVSGRDVDKSALVESEPGTLPGVPLLIACPVNLECRVVEDLTVEGHRIFLARVVETHVDEAYVSEADGRFRIAPVQDLDPILYALDNQYYSVGKPIGTGYQEGAKLTAES